jgi:hypothetical protein
MFPVIPADLTPSVVQLVVYFVTIVGILSGVTWASHL